MMLQNLEQQVLELPLDGQLQIVRSVLASIQQKAHWSEMVDPIVADANTLPETVLPQAIHPWAQSLVGVIKPSEGDDTEAYIDYLEEKYR